MLTDFERILLRDGNFGRLLRQITHGATPFYLVVTMDGSERIVAAGDFAGTDWDGVDRRQGERRRVRASLAATTRAQPGGDRRASERRQFVVRRMASR